MTVVRHFFGDYYIPEFDMLLDKQFVGEIKEERVGDNIRVSAYLRPCTVNGIPEVSPWILEAYYPVDDTPDPTELW